MADSHLYIIHIESEFDPICCCIALLSTDISMEMHGHISVILHCPCKTVVIVSGLNDNIIFVDIEEIFEDCLRFQCRDCCFMNALLLFKRFYLRL